MQETSLTLKRSTKHLTESNKKYWPFGYISITSISQIDFSLRKLITISLITCLFAVNANGQSRSSSETNSHLVKLFPNPASTYINIDVSKVNSNNTFFQIFNFMGRKVYESRLSSPRTSLYLNDFFRGMYIYQLRDRNGAVLETGKFQILK